MNFDKTPSELALEDKVRRLERELYYYRAENRSRSDYLTPRSPSDPDRIELQTLSPPIQLVKTAEIAAKTETFGSFNVVARTFPKRGFDGLGCAYYVSQDDLFGEKRVQVELLRYLHEDFTHQLAGALRIE